VAIYHLHLKALEVETHPVDLNKLDVRPPSADPTEGQGQSKHILYTGQDNKYNLY
jgi:hypothetical protein